MYLVDILDVYSRIFEEYNIDDSLLKVEELVRDTPAILIQRSEIITGFKIAKTLKENVENFLKFEIQANFVDLFRTFVKDRRIKGDKLPEKDRKQISAWIRSRAFKHQSRRIIGLLEKVENDPYELDIISIKELGPLFYHVFQDRFNFSLYTYFLILC